jgi:hypothetical protein
MDPFITSLNDVLKYKASEDLLRAAFTDRDEQQGRQSFYDANHYLVSADAMEEEGKEGVADILRRKAKALQDNEPNWIPGASIAERGPTFGSVDDCYLGSVSAIGEGEHSIMGWEVKPHTPKKIHFELNATMDGMHHSGLGFMLDPEEAEHVVKRLPNAEAMTAFIRKHSTPHPPTGA